MARVKTDENNTTAADRALKLSHRSANVTARDVARRAYDIYIARGCEHGHDVEDWLQAERELREAARPTAV
jgi:Protein of unknown function (DUF2934)